MWTYVFLVALQDAALICNKRPEEEPALRIRPHHNIYHEIGGILSISVVDQRGEDLRNFSNGTKTSTRTHTHTKTTHSHTHTRTCPQAYARKHMHTCTRARARAHTYCILVRKKSIEAQKRHLHWESNAQQNGKRTNHNRDQTEHEHEVDGHLARLLREERCGALLDLKKTTT